MGADQYFRTFYKPERFLLQPKAPGEESTPATPSWLSHTFLPQNKMTAQTSLGAKKHIVSMHWHQQQRAQPLPGRSPSTVPNTNIPIFKITEQPGYGGRYRDVCVLVSQLNSFPSDHKTYMQTKLQCFLTSSWLPESCRSDKGDQNQNFCLVICPCILICPKDVFNRTFVS